MVSFWRFSPPDPSLGPPLAGAYDPLLVLLSIVVACAAGLIALLIVDRMTAAKSASGRRTWHVAGAFAMGWGIWSMHFTGMLAYSVPVNMAYDATLTLVSMVPAILGSAATLLFVAKPEMHGRRLQVAALAMALGIGTMHYTGMEAMQLQGMLRYDFAYFVLSIVVAHVLAMVAIQIRFALRQFARLGSNFLNAVTGTVMGLAVVSMHYTAMAASRIYPAPGMGLDGWTFPQTGMAVTIAAVTIGILAMGVTAVRLEKKAVHDVLEELAYTDSLTGLPNRVSLGKHLDHAMGVCDRLDTHLAVLFVDLNDFKAVNDGFGHEAGDRLLRVLARQLDGCMREADMVARFGGDEFVVVAQGLSTPEDVGPVIDRLGSALDEPLELDGRQLSIRASIGVSVYPGDGDTAQELIQRADTAMYQAKADGYRFRFFDAELAERAYQRVWLSGELRMALQERQLTFHYQPWVDLDSGRWMGVEALARWPHPQHGAISPGHFIPVAERTGLMGELDAWAVQEACRQARAWLDAGVQIGRIAVNLSAQEFQRSDIVTRMRRAMEQAGVPGTCLEIEITESSLISDERNAIDRLRQLRGLGLTLSVDDFGTGYSSLSYLKSLPVDKLKIDRAFISDEDPKDYAIVRAVVEMANSLGFAVAAEGIETETQRQMLQDLGCTMGQGFLFARPAAADRIEHAFVEGPAGATMQAGAGAR